MNNIKILPSLLVFAEVAQRQSFTAAAAHLKMSKSAVSQHVQRLEEQIGTALLNRHTRGMSLTAVGAKLLGSSELLAGQVDAALMDIASAEQAPSGVFSVTCPHSMEQDVLVPALAQLTVEFPMLEPRIIVSDSALDLVYEDLDVSIFAGKQKETAYRSLPLGTLDEVYCVSPTYLQRHGKPSKAEDFSQHRWISIPWQSHTITSMDRGGEPKTTNITPYAQSNTLSGAVEMALNHMGVVLLPDITASKLVQKGVLTPVMEHCVKPVWPLHFVHPYQGKKPQHISRFYQLFRHYLKKAKTAA